MTPADRELLARAASAAGVSRSYWDATYLAERGIDLAQDMLWNPLTSNGDAMWLAVKLPGLNLQRIIYAAALDSHDHYARCAYVRRAITTAAAA